jgi:RHS repeat-associated protein
VEGGTITATSYYFANGQRIAQRKTRDTESELLFVHTDHLGSAVRLTDMDGEIVQSIVYEPFGQTVYSAGSTGNAYQFTSQELDSGTGLYYYDARYYDPLLGRFVQADVVLDGLNRYAYCHNNPVMYTDPTGHFIFAGLLSIFGPIGTGIGYVIDQACWGAVIGAATGAAINTGIQAYNIATGHQSNWDWESFGSAIGSGAVYGSIGGAIGGICGLASGTAFSTAGSGGGTIVSYGPGIESSLQVLPFYSNGTPIILSLTHPSLSTNIAALFGSSGNLLVQRLLEKYQNTPPIIKPVPGKSDTYHIIDNTPNNKSTLEIQVEDGVVHIDFAEKNNLQKSLDDISYVTDQVKQLHKQIIGRDLKITKRSLASEIYMHAWLYNNGFFKSHTDVADCGESGKDSNRWVWDIFF